MKMVITSVLRLVVSWFADLGGDSNLPPPALSGELVIVNGRIATRQGAGAEPGPES